MGKVFSTWVLQLISVSAEAKNAYLKTQKKGKGEVKTPQKILTEYLEKTQARQRESGPITSSVKSRNFKPQAKTELSFSHP